MICTENFPSVEDSVYFLPKLMNILNPADFYSGNSPGVVIEIKSLI